MWKKVMMISLFFLFLSSMVIALPTVQAASGISLYTPYTGIAVTPGENIDYSIEVINHTGQIQQVTFAVEKLTEDWKYEITSGGWKLHKLSVKPNESKLFTLTVDVPLKIQKGDYSFQVTATSDQGFVTTLPLTITVSEKGVFKTELSTEQPNMEGHADSTFTYQVSLKNRTAEKQHYALTSNAPKGWDVQFKADGNRVTSVSVDTNEAEEIYITVIPSKQVKAGAYKIPIKASTNSTSAETELEAVITGTYDLQLSTPTGRLSTDMNAGREKEIELELKNTGTVPLRDIRLSADAPIDWNVEFDQEKIDKLESGETVHVKATLKASDQAIAGDYVVNMQASTPEAASDAQFRVSVKTSVLWGWVGILIILMVAGGLYYLIRTYGRR